MRDGSDPPVWEGQRGPQEDWDAFVERCASEAQAALQRLSEQQLARPDGARIVYHLAWAIPQDRRRGMRHTGAPDSLEDSAT
jgi:hypothetical protein